LPADRGRLGRARWARRDSVRRRDRLHQSEFWYYDPAQHVRLGGAGRHRQRLWRTRWRHRHRPEPGMVDAVLQSTLEAGCRIRDPDPNAPSDAAGYLRSTADATMSVDFWIGVAVIAGIYGIAALGLQLSAGVTGLLHFGQAGFMAIGAYSISLL